MQVKYIYWFNLMTKTLFRYVCGTGAMEELYIDGNWVSCIANDVLSAEGMIQVGVERTTKEVSP
jgi:hypothetical protein